MITGELKSKVDRLWTTFWNNGISNPLSVIEQISYLLFIKRLDDLELAKEKQAQRLGRPIKDAVYSTEQQQCRWSYFKNITDSEEMLRVVRDEAFPFIKNLGGTARESAYSRHMKDAVFLIASPALLANVVTQIDQIPMEDRDTKGDLYEYMLSKLTTAGTNGQFRTPRHIIKMIGKGYVDYVLWGDDGKPLALVEAKRTTASATKGKHQAELYANCLENRFNQRPVIFYSNGYEHWMWDDVSYPPRTVQGFLKKDELERLIFRRTHAKRLHLVTPSSDIAGRSYQLEGIRRITENFDGDKKARKSLLVMATGTGKTRVAISLVDLLRRANWVKRVLFLADRNALLTQAFRAFQSHLPTVIPIDLTKDKNAYSADVVLSTYPTMFNAINNFDGSARLFGPGHFDLMIVDEAHRSIYKKYRALFEYFDALVVGLTATPRSEVHRDTYQIFDLQAGVPTFAYELQDAIEDGYLVPSRGVEVPFKFMRKGVKYGDLSPGEQEEYEEKFRDEETGEVPDEVNAAALNRWLLNISTVDQALEILMERGLKVDGGDRLGKTIIFNQDIKEADPKLQPSLASRLVKVRLELSEVLKQSDTSSLAHTTLREALLDDLHQHVATMEPENFLIRRYLKPVEEFATRERWQELSEEDVETIAEHLAPLPNGLPQENHLIKRFDLLCLKLQLAVLKGQAEFVGLRDKVRDLMERLEEKKTIPMIAAKLPLIEEVQAEEWWSDVTIEMIEQMRQELRTLVQFIDKQSQQIVYTNFQDELYEVKEATVPYHTAGFSSYQYRKKVEGFIRAHEDFLVISKLKRNVPLTPGDIGLLEKMLFSAKEVESRERFEEEYGSDISLKRLIREIVGLDRNAAKEAFARYLSGSRFSANQIRFVENIIDYLTQKGVMDPGMLYEAQFREIHDEGLDGVFEDSDAEEIISIVRSFNETVEATFDSVA